MIKNKNKINAIIKNAKIFVELNKDYKNYRNYILSFVPNYPKADISEIRKLRQDLRKRFAFIGPATVNHLLTDYRLPVLKPDRMIMRVLYRTHLLKTENLEDFDKAIEIGQIISNKFKLPIRYVDTVLVCLGQVGEANICRKKDPKCNICELEKICKF